MNSPSSVSQRELVWKQLDKFGYIEGESVEDVIRLFCTVCHVARHGTIVLQLSWGHTIILQRKLNM
ncbi:hypothetical protein HanXRQr2_Chr12g0542081 [Helianthus annuus]|uniref:Uncharacterized protein n=1 Tax=Helianthus annuus TaxID=4232 RepID=A0A251T277_HELAN|nr:hypothetical protein HanXRQr2_Chr12g0542081 [Helianthus annuus]KAJ0862740.1 hypothetical protein HanPSC8_Chr12g0521841 [Helianthus annuus]